tara:strand:+ start:3012 stop:3143 length:132 start_codon:yes stop_codon:yes gene_type:complete
MKEKLAVLSDQIKTESPNQQNFYDFDHIIAQIRLKALFFNGLK